MDIPRMWRSMRADPADAPHAGTHLETAEPGITISVTQECQIALPPQNNLIPAVSVTVTSQRPGMAAQVVIGANFNTRTGATRVLRQGSDRASSPPPTRSSKPVSSFCPPAFPCSASAPWPIGRTERKALP